MRSQIDPMKKVAPRSRKHRPLLLNWFRAKGQFSSGIVEGFNNKAKLTTRKAYGFRAYHATENALYHALGALPVLKTTREIFFDASDEKGVVRCALTVEKQLPIFAEYAFRLLRGTFCGKSSVECVFHDVSVNRKSDIAWPPYLETLH